MSAKLILVLLSLCIFHFALFTSPIYAQLPTPSPTTKTINVSASVPTNSNHYSISLIPAQTGGDFSQDTILNYQINYGTNLNFATNVTIEAAWNQGVIQGLSAPSIDIVDYVMGSSSQAPGNVQPVVDLINKKIDWTLSLPANAQNQTVYFSLHTIPTFTGTNRVNFTVASRIITSGFVTPDSVANQSYRFDPNKYNTYSTPSTSSTTTTTTPVTTYTAPPPTNSTYIPPKYPIPLGPPAPFVNLFITSVSPTDAKFFIDLQSKLFPAIKYGTDPKNLNNSVSSFINSTRHEIDVNELKPDTSYYFKAEVKDDKGKVVGTDTYIFKSAQVSDKPEIEDNSLIVSSGNNVLNVTGENQTGPNSPAEQVSKAKQQNTIVVPEKSAYQIRFKLKKSASIKQVKAFVRSKNVLGISSLFEASAEDTPTQEEVDLTEIEPGVFVGKLNSPPKDGYFEVIARITDNKGNIVESKVADLRVLKKFTVLNQSNQPIEAVRALLYLYNAQTRKFDVLSPTATSIKNPSFSDNHGEFAITLPQGKYKVDLADIGYNDQTVEFTIGTGAQDGFPNIHLEKAPFNILRVFRYHFRNITEVMLLAAADYVNSIVVSLRLFDTFSSFSLAVLIFLTVFSFSRRTHISLINLPRFIFYHLQRLFQRASESRLVGGWVVDQETKRLLPGAHVFLIKADGNQIIDQSVTTERGQFISKGSLEGDYHLMVMKKGYKPSPLLAYPHASGSPDKFIVGLEKAETSTEYVLSHLEGAAFNIVGFSFELLLATSLLFEVLFVRSFGLARTLPFLAMSFINLGVWFIYLRSSRLRMG